MEDAEGRPVIPWPVSPMLAHRAKEPFDSPGWIFEVKHNGIRCLAHKSGDRIELRSREGADITAAFPEVVGGLGRLPWEEAVLDGELVCLAGDGLKCDLGAVQRRLGMARPGSKAVAVAPVRFFAFDLLAGAQFSTAGLGSEGIELALALAYQPLDFTPAPLVKRKELLHELLQAAPSGALVYVDHIVGEGKAAFAETKRHGLEGVMAKRADSPYKAGQRSHHWLKVT